MNQIKTILVGVDFSDGARAALEHALRIGTANRALMHVLHVIDEGALGELARTLHRPLTQQKAHALASGRAELVRWLEPFGLPETCRTEVATGDPLNVLLARAQELACDLIVVGAQGDNTTSPQAGSVAVRLLRRAPMKVLLVDSTHARPFQAIVACVDFTPTAREVVEQAKRLASLCGARVDFLHVYDPPWHRLRHVLPALSASADLQEQYVHTLERELKDFVGEVPGLNARQVLHESPRHRCGIAAYAQLQDADLVVLATRGLTSAEDEVLSSTAERLVRELPCSVLAVRAPAPSSVAG